MAAYLQQRAQTDLEKARAIYVWLADNLAYDADALNSGLYIDGYYSPDQVLRSRKAVCGEFSMLYVALGRQMGLEVEFVGGYPKEGDGYTSGTTLTEPDHAWNAIRIDGEWRIFDATWGEGNVQIVDGRLVHTKHFNDSWFNVDPYEAIFTHLPEDGDFAWVNPRIDLRTFQTLPEINQQYFELGFDGKETYEAVRANRKLKFPRCYDIGTPVEARSAPKYQGLQTNRPYLFEFHVPRGLGVAIVDAYENWTHFEFDRQRDVFALQYTPRTQGELGVWVKHDEGGDSYRQIMTYNVHDVATTVQL